MPNFAMKRVGRSFTLDRFLSFGETMLNIAVLGTLDTKGLEHQYLADCIRERGHRALLIDVGSGLPPTVRPDIDRDTVRRCSLSASEDLSAPIMSRSSALPSASDATISPLPSDRGAAIAVMSAAAQATLLRLFEQHAIHGVVSLGGSGGTSLATSAMRTLPLGFPKVMVSTMASGNVAPYVDVSDIIMIPSIVDVSGLNRVSRSVIERAAAVVIALAETNQLQNDAESCKPIVAASMFGNTTRCVEHAKSILEDAGYEVLVFHATGTGGRSMESLIRSGMIAGVLDLTTTEWADELVGGVLRAGPERLEAAARFGVPAVIAPGCLDMVNFGEPTSVPEHFQGRTFYQHNPQVTLMRTTPEECAQLGSIIASKLNLSVGKVEVHFPLQAISVISAPGQPFHDPIADQALLNSLRASLRSDIPLRVYDGQINDPAFAESCAKALIYMMQSTSTVKHPQID